MADRSLTNLLATADARATVQSQLVTVLCQVCSAEHVAFCESIIGFPHTNIRGAASSDAERKNQILLETALRVRDSTVRSALLRELLPDGGTDTTATSEYQAIFSETYQSELNEAVATAEKLDPSLGATLLRFFL